MKGTLEMLSTIIDPKDLERDLEEIALEYQDTLNPQLLAVTFKRVYKLIFSISSNYLGLTNDDIASYSLFELDKALLTFNELERAKFTTYITTLLKNRFRTETQALNADKRKAIFNSNSYETMVENGFDLVAEDLEDLSFLDDLNLNKHLKQYCHLLIRQYTNKEIAKKLGVSVMTLSNWRRVLREKLILGL